MNCRDKNIKDLLPGYCERKLDRAEQKRVEDHLASCADCRGELSLLKVLREEAVPDPGEAFWSQLPERIFREVREQKSDTQGFDLARLGNWFVLPRWAWATAAAAIVVLVSWFLINPFGAREEEAHVLTEVYDHSYGSLHDSTLTHPSMDTSDLSATELDTVGTWAANELSRMAVQAEPNLLNTQEHELSEELADLDTDQMERLSTMLKDYDEEG